MQTSEHDFSGLGISPNILGRLERLKFTKATPIQHKAIPIALEGKDLVGIAQTGTGKTLAFGIPMVQRLASSDRLGLVLVPTRELAVQVRDNIVKVVSKPPIKTAVLIGGDPIAKQLKQLAQKPRILIATPGRLIDLMEQRKVRLDQVAFLVLDEADRMFDMGFAPQIYRILKEIPTERQTLFFSATMPPDVMKLATTHMKFPMQVEIAPQGTAAEKVSHELFIVRLGGKKEVLAKVLQDYRGSILLFTRTKRGADNVARSIRGMGHTAAEIHSDLTLAQRRKALDGFKSGQYRILVATDIAARGIDVAGIEAVINYDLPDEAENYVHRIGRTGRAGMTGHAISFATPSQRNLVQAIERLINMTLPISQFGDASLSGFAKPKTFFSAHRNGGRWKKNFRR